MPYVAGLIGALFAGIMGFLVEYIAKRYAIVLAVVAVVTTFVIGFFAAIVGLIELIEHTAPPWVEMASSWVIPDNFPLIASTMATARVLRWAYEWNIKIIQYRLF